MVVNMSTCLTLDPDTIRLECELIRSRWETQTAAERRASAIALQRALAQQIGMGLILGQSSDERPSSSMGGAA